RKRVQFLKLDPLCACEIRRGNDALLLGQDGEAVVTCLERQRLWAHLRRTHCREHLAADLIDVIAAPLDRQRRAGQRQAEFLDLGILHDARSGGRCRAARALARCSGVTCRATRLIAIASTAASSVNPTPATKSGTASKGKTK